MQKKTKNHDQISRRELILGMGSLLATGTALINSASLCEAQEKRSSTRRNSPRSFPLQVFCGTGDHLWGRHLEPVDSPATIHAMLEWMSETYSISRIYWRGGQTMMWDEHFRIEQEKLLPYDWTAWKHHLYHDLKINEVVVSAAHQHKMEAFLYMGLFEFGVQPDIGVIGPYPFEDEIRREHPEWCPVDRWGERRCPGPISFCYPEARKLIIDRYVKNLKHYNYDGICFYTYVENCGILYEDEFGFNQPIVEEFNQRYPDVNLKRDQLTATQKQYWYACRGKFTTDFLRELKAELSRHGKKLSVIIDAKNPDYVQPWWGQTVAGSGKIKMDWRLWVREKIVDELWIQLAPTKNQHETLDLVRKECDQYGVKLTVRAIDPFENGWKPYIKSGVTPVAVITWKRNGIERFTHQQIDEDSLRSADWKVRLQALTDVESGKLKVTEAQAGELASDIHVLVRRRAMYVLAAMKAHSQVATIETGMFDDESSVRIAATGALAAVHRKESALRIFAALEKDGYFQIKLAAVEALSAMKEQALTVLLEGVKSSHYAVREVSVRALSNLGAAGFVKDVFPSLFATIVNREEDERVRRHALTGLAGLRLKLDQANQDKLMSTLMDLASTDTSVLVQLRAARELGSFYVPTTSTGRDQIVECLAAGFRKYGDACQRSDAAYGWRLFGNALLMCHERGRKQLEAMRLQKDDKWLAWLAYEVEYLPHRQMKISMIEEEEALERHKKFAPPFPGYRTKVEVNP